MISKYEPAKKYCKKVRDIGLGLNNKCIFPIRMHDLRVAFEGQEEGSLQCPFT